MKEDPIFYMIKQIHEEMKDINKKVDEIVALKWKITGASIVICGFIALLFEFGKIALKGG